MTDLLQRFSKGQSTGEPGPSMNDLLGSLANPTMFPAARSYLDARPDLKANLQGIVTGLAEESRAVELAAYYRYLERKRNGDWPLDGRDWEDWFAAEKRLPMPTAGVRAA